MFSLLRLSCTFLVLFLYLSGTNADFPRPRRQRKSVPYPTVYVDQSGKGNFATIQSAIDFVPSNNNKWICIHIRAGIYREAVHIPQNKPFIFLEGEGQWKTYVVWNNHDSIQTGATFNSDADNIIVKGTTFVNSYNLPVGRSQVPIKPAPAARIWGDKSSFYRCGFLGFQDTLFDVQGRHYFNHCTIQGAIDFICGAGQSMYERCTIVVTTGALNGLAGFITAQSRSYDRESSGFVFKDCNIVGNGKTFLGRAWGDYARVVFYNTMMSDIVVPLGWNSWDVKPRYEYQITFQEYQCKGRGANTSGRVTWANKLDLNELMWLTSLSFIDGEGWMKGPIFDALDGDDEFDYLN